MYSATMLKSLIYTSDIIFIGGGDSGGGNGGGDGGRFRVFEWRRWRRNDDRASGGGNGGDGDGGGTMIEVCKIQPPPTGVMMVVVDDFAVIIEEIHGGLWMSRLRFRDMRKRELIDRRWCRLGFFKFEECRGRGR
ncbi:hypothetical protein HanPSC8_Chr12g0522531 [Helianthus annuus]|nr:hypothetical protein HanPSC8_Chr12g0522531 [Helianthus annuus]